VSDAITTLPVGLGGVLAAIEGLQVCRVAAATKTACVVYFEAIRDLTAVHPVDGPVEHLEQNPVWATPPLTEVAIRVEPVG
jgi:hypothetical protein